jgi:hypothetical protein
MLCGYSTISRVPWRAAAIEVRVERGTTGMEAHTVRLSKEHAT